MGDTRDRSKSGVAAAGLLPTLRDAALRAAPQGEVFGKVSDYERATPTPVALMGRAVEEECACEWRAPSHESHDPSARATGRHFLNYALAPQANSLSLYSPVLVPSCFGHRVTVHSRPSTDTPSERRRMMSIISISATPAFRLGIGRFR